MTHLSDDFDAWFDGSCVVDGRGAPLEVYHGTGNLQGLDAFSPEITGKGNDQLGSGFYFTTSREEASGYATAVTASAGPGARKLGGDDSPGVLMVHLAIKRPITVCNSNLADSDAEVAQHDAFQIICRVPDIRNLEKTPLVDHLDLWGKSEITDKMINMVAKRYVGTTLMDLEGDFFRNDPTGFREAVHAVMGFDGVTVDHGNGVMHFVAWFPDQIRTAFGGLRMGNRPADDDALDACEAQQGSRRERERPRG